MNKITVNREQLLNRLSKALRFVPDPAVIPMFENFKFIINNGIMEIMAADNAMQIKLWCPVESKTNFAICVPAALLFKTITLFRENEVTITQKDHKSIELKSGKAEYNITMDCLPETYTPMVITDIHSEITMHQSMLNMSLKNAKDFINEKHANANFTVLNMADIDNRIVFTGATSARICRVSIRPISINAWKSVAFTVTTAKKILALLGDKGEVTIVHSGNKIKFFTSGDLESSFEMISVVHNGPFPNTEQFFAKVPQSYVSINTTELNDALKRLALYYAIGENPQVRVSNTLNSQEFKLSSTDANTGKNGEETISIMNPSSLVFDKTLLNEAVTEVLEHTDAAEVNLHFDPNQGPWFIIPKVENEEENLLKFMLSHVQAQ